VRCMCAGIADCVGIKVGEEQYGMCGNTVVVIEPASPAARFGHA
jgi:hypothetical protein